MGAAEVAEDVFLRVAPFLIRDHGDGPAVDLGQTAGHGGVVAEEAVAVQFGEILEAEGKVVQGERAGRVPSDLHALPSGQVLVDFLPHAADFLFDLPDLRVDTEVRAIGLFTQPLQLLFQLGDGFFEIQRLDFHGRAFWPVPRGVGSIKISRSASDQPAPLPFLHIAAGRSAGRIDRQLEE